LKQKIACLSILTFLKNVTRTAKNFDAGGVLAFALLYKRGLSRQWAGCFISRG